MQTKIIERYFFFGLLLTTLIFNFFIFRPFWIVLVLGASFSIVLYPIHEWLTKHKLPNWLSAFLTVLFFTIVICGPLFGIGVMVFNQTQNFYHSIAGGGDIATFLNSTGRSIDKFLPQGVNFDINAKVSDFISSLSGNLAQIFSATVSTVISFILMLLAIFYFLKDGAKWKKSVVRLSPLSDIDDQKIIKRLSSTINGVITSSLFIALVQGTMMGLGLAIFGIPSPALWGVVAAITSLIPTVGTSLVSIPSIIFLFTTGNTIGGVGLLIWSAIMVGSIDNFLSPLVVSNKIDIPSFIILFAVLGGIALLGPIGVLIGPLAISLLYTLVSIYRNEFQIQQG